MELNIKTLSSGLNDNTDIPVETKASFAGTIKTSYLQTGYGIPVILLHGGGAGALAWRPVIKDVSKLFCAIAPDLVGYGESDKPHAIYDRHFFSQWLRDFMDALGLEKCVLVGHSLGGAIALQFAMDHPNRVERLALVCSAGLGLSFPLIPLLNGIFLYSFPSRMTSWQLHTYLVHRPENLDEKFIEYAWEVCRKPGGKRAFWRGCGRAVFPVPPDRLKKITHRTMLIWGAEDRVFPLTHAYRAMRIMPHVQLPVIPQAGHIPFFDQPALFNNILLQFLEGQIEIRFLFTDRRSVYTRSTLILGCARWGNGYLVFGWTCFRLSVRSFRWRDCQMDEYCDRPSPGGGWSCGCVVLYLGRRSAWATHPETVVAYRIPLLAVLALQVLAWTMDWVKYRRFSNYHAYSAKAFGLSIFLATVMWFGYEPLDGLMWLVVISGLVCMLEEIAITFLLPHWIYDVPSVFHAIKIKANLASLAAQ